MDDAIRRKTKLHIFSFPGTVRLSGEIAGKMVAMATSLEKSKIKIQIVHLQP